MPLGIKIMVKMHQISPFPNKGNMFAATHHAVEPLMFSLSGSAPGSLSKIFHKMLLLAGRERGEKLFLDQDLCKTMKDKGKFNFFVVSFPYCFQTLNLSVTKTSAFSGKTFGYIVARLVADSSCSLLEYWDGFKNCCLHFSLVTLTQKCGNMWSRL